MVAISIVIAFIASIFQVTQAFCVYNRLTASTDLPTFVRVTAGQIKRDSFKATLVGYDSKACCPFTNRSCNRTGSLIKRYDLSFDGETTPLSPGSYCDAGGALALYGTYENFYAECTSPNGTVSEAYVNRWGIPPTEDLGIL
ncbi:uncharacterized protein EV154DRAFT_483788 [Mucor mucedo]|uniref:uncharacterized protein n=1 Tax=Mucor mucedo TaxID=29922 RepID=UPI00221F4BD8|nr:uncharacterized protein EV154DRAFT_483788 [Mucor mucedo]KAI7888723.1 hypothetical protein EV154DRAFT_483788 [Mucor mucedo]